MTQSTLSWPQTIFASTFDDVPWPVDAVFVVDDNLGFSTDQHATIQVRAGEELKTLARIASLADEVLALRASRPLTLIAVGGGSVGDAIGFLASILWRGVDLWHVPTTLLAAVDSAYGGKTAVNLSKHKNQLGTFYPAQKVVLMEEFFARLPPRAREDGLAELVKAFWLQGDASRLKILDEKVETWASHPWPQISADLLEAVMQAAEIKRAVVEADPFEKSGHRSILNLGHTVAHALELQLGLSHGHAVAWGLATTASLSHEQGLLTPSLRDRLHYHVYPLLEALPEFRLPSAADFDEALRRDKKRREGKLRSILLEGPGKPIITEDITASDWYQALRRTISKLHGTPLQLDASATRWRILPEIEPGKSELNRLQMLAFLSEGRIEYEGQSTADDVIALQEALARLGQADEFEDVEIHAGKGGTTFRFLLAAAACRPGQTTLWVDPQLFGRPHQPLLDALQSGGAVLQVDENCFRVRGWNTAPATFRVDASTSSQFISALAMLSVHPHFPRLTIEHTGTLASRSYLELTLDLIRKAGVIITERQDAFDFQSARQDRIRMKAEKDASTWAAFIVAAELGLDVEPGPPPTRQPDTAITEFVREVLAHQEGELVLDLSLCPDLVCVLSVLIVASRKPVRLVGAAHLRVKESNRIDDLIGSWAALGVTWKAHEDGLSFGGEAEVSAGTFATHGDHRMAMAAALISLAFGIKIEIDDAFCVAKSAPRYFHTLRAAGIRAMPAPHCF